LPAVGIAEGSSLSPAKAGNAPDHAGVGLPSRRHCPPFLVVGADKLRKLDVPLHHADQLRAV